MSATATSRPVRLAGVPLTSWAFALRTWAAMVLALGVAFWLQLESASSAAVCVGILALPTRGQSFQKSFYRFAGTVIGVVASIVIAGALNGTREPFIVASAAWVALCVFAAGLLDGNRAYGAVLSGYTVAIVAVAEIDAPTDVFAAGVNRGAAIAIGILAVALVNDVFAAPDLFPGVLAKLMAARAALKQFVAGTLRRGDTTPGAVTGLLRQITALHADITALPGESIAGRARADAARTAVTAMVREVAATRAVAATLGSLGSVGEEARGRVAAAIEADGDEKRDLVLERAERVAEASEVDDPRLVAACASLVLLDQSRVVNRASVDLRTGRTRGRGPRLPLYKSRRSALRDALRVFLTVSASAVLFALSGWPGASAALLQITALAGISATNPNPKGFAVGALIAMPIAAATAGITQFLILDGVDAFPLLALAMAPPVMAGALLIASGNQKLFGIGFLIVVFFPVLLGPSNPQAYNPETYLFNSLFAIVSVILLFVFLTILLPTDDARRRRWALASARSEMWHALAGRKSRLSPPAAAYRDADRISQVSGYADGSPSMREAHLRLMLFIADLAAAARRLHAALDQVQRAGCETSATAEAKAALAATDPDRLRRMAGRLRALSRAASDVDLRTCYRRASADAVWAAILIEREPDMVASLREARP